MVLGEFDHYTLTLKNHFMLFSCDLESEYLDEMEEERIKNVLPDISSWVSSPLLNTSLLICERENHSRKKKLQARNHQVKLILTLK